MTIGIFLIATGKYIFYIPKLCEGINKYFLTNHQKTIYVFTDAKEVPACVEKVQIEHNPWPASTLLRYNYISEFCKKENIKYDYYYYIDSDSYVVDTIGDEILGDLVVTIHPGFYKKSFDYTIFDRKFLAKSYVNPNKVERYVCGGFNGGVKYLEMAEQIAEWVNIDQKYGHIPQWHDESYLNKYCSINKPDIILTPEYCMPETYKERLEWGLLGMKGRIIAITKKK